MKQVYRQEKWIGNVLGLDIVTRKKAIFLLQCNFVISMVVLTKIYAHFGLCPRQAQPNVSILLDDVVLNRTLNHASSLFESKLVLAF